MRPEYDRRGQRSNRRVIAHCVGDHDIRVWLVRVDTNGSTVFGSVGMLDGPESMSGMSNNLGLEKALRGIPARQN